MYEFIFLISAIRVARPVHFFLLELGSSVYNYFHRLLGFSFVCNTLRCTFCKWSCSDTSVQSRNTPGYRHVIFNFHWKFCSKIATIPNFISLYCISVTSEVRLPVIFVIFVIERYEVPPVVFAWSFTKVRHVIVYWWLYVIQRDKPSILVWSCRPGLVFRMYPVRMSAWLLALVRFFAVFLSIATRISGSALWTNNASPYFLQRYDSSAKLHRYLLTPCCVLLVMKIGQWTTCSGLTILCVW